MAKKITKKAIRAMRGQTDLYDRLATEHSIKNRRTVRRWVLENKGNGPLTTAASLTLISEALGVTVKHILEDETN